MAYIKKLGDRSHTISGDQSLSDDHQQPSYPPSPTPVMTLGYLDWEIRVSTRREKELEQVIVPGSVVNEALA